MESESSEQTKAPIQVQSGHSAETQFNRIFAGELLKSALRRTRLIMWLTLTSIFFASLIMILGHQHFESIGDQAGLRYRLLLLGSAYLAYQGFNYWIISRKIRSGQSKLGKIALLNAIVEPGIITLWLLIEAFLFRPGAMFESPMSYGYPLVILLSALHLSWLYCLLVGCLAAGQYLILIAWYSMTYSGQLEQTISSYLPLHGMRAVCFLLVGAAAAFIAHEIRKSISQTLLHVKERDFVVSIFGRYLSDDVVDDILRSPEGLRLGGRRRTITVMMTDLRGFTSLSENLPPESVIAMLNHCLARMTDVIVKYQGTIDEFIGDAILAIFGAPFSNDNDAERAVACAIEMQLAMEQVNQWNQAQGYPRLEMGIGIHTGPAVVGNIGSEKRSKYGIVGSTVNLTSRIESYTVGGQILLSGATASLLSDQLEIDMRREILPKGYSDPIEICSVVGIKGNPDLQLPRQHHDLKRLDSALDIQILSLQGKDSGGQWQSAQLVALSSKRAKIVSNSALELDANLKIATPANSLGLLNQMVAKIIDVKTVEDGYEALLHFV